MNRVQLKRPFRQLPRWQLLGNCHSIAETAFGTEAYATRPGSRRAPACIASSTADLWLLLSRTNDSTTAGMSRADTKAKVMKIVTAFLNTPGKPLIVGTGTPRFASRALAGQALSDAIAYKDWVLNYVSQFVPVVNIWDGFTEAMTVEGLHPNLLGADFISSRVVPIITANFEFPGIPLPTDAGDIYSPIRPFGCLNANPLLAGIGGTLPAGVNAVAGSVLADAYKAVGSGLAGITTRWYKEPAAYGEAQCVELAGNMAAAGGYIYVQPSANVVQTNLAAGDVIEMVLAVDIVGASRGILAWEAELTITKPVSGASTTFYYRSMDKYQEPFTMPASFSGDLETQRGTIDLTETVITSGMGLYLAAGVAQSSTAKVLQFGIRKV
ncbi:hypothetical protein [Pseudomonas cannabina]|uniref:hypothetical protein n=1 Tax=Pseudomonas cannabina TaxID=86840 RepID=UPI00070B3CCA|nr:hypothetical protein [Pseudomonas cannabina]